MAKLLLNWEGDHKIKDFGSQRDGIRWRRKYCSSWSKVGQTLVTQKKVDLKIGQWPTTRNDIKNMANLSKLSHLSEWKNENIGSWLERLSAQISTSAMMKIFFFVFRCLKKIEKVLIYQIWPNCRALTTSVQNNVSGHFMKRLWLFRRLPSYCRKPNNQREKAFVTVLPSLYNNNIRWWGNILSGVHNKQSL